MFSAPSIRCDRAPAPHPRSSSTSRPVRASSPAPTTWFPHAEARRPRQLAAVLCSGQPSEKTKGAGSPTYEGVGRHRHLHEPRTSGPAHRRAGQGSAFQGQARGGTAKKISGGASPGGIGDVQCRPAARGRAGRPLIRVTTESPPRHRPTPSRRPGRSAGVHRPCERCPAIGALDDLRGQDEFAHGRRLPGPRATGTRFGRSRPTRPRDSGVPRARAPTAAAAAHPCPRRHHRYA